VQGSGFFRNAAIGAAVLGGLGFLCGFLGPIVLSPDANQGPLLGIFITGPAGALLGALLGAATGALGVSPQGFRTVLIVAGALLAATTLFFSTPQPEYRASVLDAEIEGCAPPRSLRDKTLSYWDETLSRTGHARAGWKEDFDRMLAEGDAVVLRLRVLRRSAIYENRKPWNRGTLEARPASPDRRQSYFATYDGGSCDAYPSGTRSQFVTSGKTSHQWPPEILANLLDLETVEPASEVYRRLAGN
jgi:hypothetical protein